jgi:hypothetical protein
VTKGLLLILLTVAAAAGAGYGACRAAGADPRVTGMIAAAAASLAASALALLPLEFVRRGSQAAVAQAALAGSMIHLVGHVLPAGAVVFAAQTLRAPRGFTPWLMAFYAATLAGVVVTLARAVRAAPPVPRPADAPPPPPPPPPQSQPATHQS